MCLSQDARTDVGRAARGVADRVQGGGGMAIRLGDRRAVPDHDPHRHRQGGRRCVVIRVITIAGLAELVSITLFIAMVAVWAAIGAGA